MQKWVLIILLTWRSIFLKFHFFVFVSNYTYFAVFWVLPFYFQILEENKPVSRPMKVSIETQRCSSIMKTTSNKINPFGLSVWTVLRLQRRHSVSFPTETNKQNILQSHGNHLRRPVVENRWAYHMRMRTPDATRKLGTVVLRVFSRFSLTKCFEIS